MADYEFDRRQKSFEKKFERDEEFRFKAAARAVREYGQWAAEKLGLTGAPADAYIKSVLEADLSKPRHADVINKVEADFAAKAIQVSRKDLAYELEIRLDKAHSTMMAEKV